MQTSEQALPGLEKPLSATLPAGDRAFESLFADHYPRLVRTLLRLLGNPARAEELAADAFYRLFLRRGRADDNPAGWLYRTAMNLGFARCAPTRGGCAAKNGPQGKTS